MDEHVYNDDFSFVNEHACDVHLENEDVNAPVSRVYDDDCGILRAGPSDRAGAGDAHHENDDARALGCRACVHVHVVQKDGSIPLYP